MNIQKKSLYLCLLITFPIASLSVNAQSADIPEYGPMPFAAYDSDHNGLISEQEFNAARSARKAKRSAEGRPMRGAASAPVFSNFDTNGDGQLSREELTAGQKAQMGNRPGMGMGQGPGMGRGMMGQEPGMGMGPGPGRGMGMGQGPGMGRGMMDQEPGMGRGMGPGPGRGMGMNRPSFSKYDLDGNGKITEKEFNEARSRRISERAQQGYPMRNIGNAPSFADIDSNGNGEISADEFYAHQSQRRQQRPQR